MSDDGTDATIGVPTASANGASNDIVMDDDVDDDATVTVYVANGAEWAEERIGPGETMEVTLPDGRPVAYVAADPVPDADE